MVLLLDLLQTCIINLKMILNNEQCAFSYCMVEREGEILVTLPLQIVTETPSLIYLRIARETGERLNSTVLENGGCSRSANTLAILHV